MSREFDPVKNLFKSLQESSMILEAGVKPVVDELKPVVGFYARKKTVELITKVDGFFHKRSRGSSVIFDSRLRNNAIHTPIFGV